MNVSCHEVPASQAVTFVSKLSIRPQITTSPFYISLVSPTPPTGSALPYRAQHALHQCYLHEEHPSLELLITTRKRYFVSCSCSRAYEGGKVTSTGHSSDQYWSQREAVVVDISYQYWSLRRPVLVRIPPPLLVVVAFRYSYACYRCYLHHHPTARREKQPILVGELTYIAPTTKLYRSR